jgi:hypothetical protein
MKQYHKKHISHYHINYGLKYKQPPTSICISHGIIEGLKPSSFITRFKPEIALSHHKKPNTLQAPPALMDTGKIN